MYQDQESIGSQKGTWIKELYQGGSIMVDLYIFITRRLIILASQPVRMVERLKKSFI
jgi:hypothetical protein